MRIRKSVANDLEAILAIINDAAQAYRGVIPSDRWHEPYMSADELAKEIASGVIFWMAEDNGQLLGVMGIQDKEDVALVRQCLYRDDGTEERHRNKAASPRRSAG